MKKQSVDYTLLESYDYILPENLIAQNPSPLREQSKLLSFTKHTKKICDCNFSQIVELLPQNALIVANNSKVLPARIIGQTETGRKVEMLLMSPVSLIEKNAESSASSKTKSCVVSTLLKGSKKIKVGETLRFPEFTLLILEKQEFGKHIVKIFWENRLASIFEKHGSLPLPPYIKRTEGLIDEDKNRYQTVYANDEKLGSVAAPTAGLHFTKELKESLIERGISWEEVTLHVGYGTFSPVRSENILEHEMHSEYVEIPAQTAQAILKAKAEKRPVIAVGTTATRSLEGMALAYARYQQGEKSENFWLSENSVPQSNYINVKGMQDEKKLYTSHAELLPRQGCYGYTDIFIYPGKSFNVIDGLITNFHLPKSTLLMLVSAFAGYEETREIYAHAIQEKYRFFSYGDAMLLL